MLVWVYEASLVILTQSWSSPFTKNQAIIVCCGIVFLLNICPINKLGSVVLSGLTWLTPRTINYAWSWIPDVITGYCPLTSTRVTPQLTNIETLGPHICIHIASYWRCRRCLYGKSKAHTCRRTKLFSVFIRPPVDMQEAHARITMHKTSQQSVQEAGLLTMIMHFFSAVTAFPRAIYTEISMPKTALRNSRHGPCCSYH